MTGHSRLASVCVLLACIATVARAAEPLKQPGVWAQSYAGRPADPDVRFDRLPNGLRYAVLRNATPPGQASLRLVIGSGSLNESDDQQGLAHFLEHMAFKGSTHVEPGELLHILQRKGLELGPDTNAATGADETVYKFNLPESDPASLDTGLMLLREIAGELTLSQAAMDSERGVILSEERLRDSPSYRTYVAELAFQLKGQLAPLRMPIGKAEIIKTAPVSRVRRFYEAQYRPDNAVVVAVGDFDPIRMEAEIARRFGDWRANAPPPPAPNLGAPPPRAADASVLVRPDATPSVSLTWAQPYDAEADTAVHELRGTLEYLALAVLNRRLEQLAESDSAPFNSATAQGDNLLHSAKLTQVTAQPGSGGWRPALAAIVGEERRLVRFGVSQAELDEAEARLRAYLTTEAAGEHTRTTPVLADAIARSAHDDEVFSSPTQDLALFDSEAQGLTPGAVMEAARSLFSGAGPLAFVASAAPIAGGEAAVKADLAAAQERPLTQEAAAASQAWPYTSFGAPGRVTSRSVISDLGVTDVRFANGVRLLIKPTAFSKDKILLAVRAGDGRRAVPAELTRALWAVDAAPVLNLGGTRELTHEQVLALTASRLVGMRLTVDDDAFRLVGRTRPAEVDTELQLLTAYVTRPGFRPQAFERMKQSLAAELPSLEGSATGVFNRVEEALLHGGDARWQDVPAAADLAASKPSDLPALLGPAFASGALDVVMVGDVTPDAAIAAVSRTFGALPPRPTRRGPASVRPVAFPAGGGPPAVITHTGRPDQAVALEAWPTTDFYADPQAQRVLGALAQALKLRLLDKVRIAEGATYSPAADIDSSQVMKGFGYIETHIETPPDKIAGFYAALDAIVADLKARPLAPDELNRVQAPRVEQRKKAQETDAYWLSALSAAAGDARQFDAIRRYVSGTEAVSAADIQAAAIKYLRPRRAYRLVVRAVQPPPA